MNIIFCGMPSAGKTTIGKLLADRINYHFVDIDTLIETHYYAKTGDVKSCRDIFHSKGEAFFRELEKEQIHYLKDMINCVIATGGGILNSEENKVLLKKMGTLVYLKTSLEVLWDRINKKLSIPAYLNGDDPKKAFYNLALTRLPLYEEVADLIINATEMNELEVVESVISYVKMVVLAK